MKTEQLNAALMEAQAALHRAIQLIEAARPTDERADAVDQLNNINEEILLVRDDLGLAE